MLITARNAGKRFGEVVALDAIDLQIDRGEIVGIIGPSGSGKTTAIRLMLGLYAPSGGEVEVFGDIPAGFSREEREKIGYLPQHFLLYEDLTVYENLLFTAGMYGLGPRVRRERADEMLDIVQLSDAKNRLARDISGGMQRRLALASTLIHEPELIVLDEPTAGIDPVLRAAIWEVFHDLRAQGRALIVTTQYVTEAEYCDRVYLINRGEVVASGSPDDLRRMVFGGEVVRVKVERLDQRLVDALLDLPYIESGRRTDREEFALVVEHAHQAIPLINEAIRERGYTILEIEEIQTSFDAIFVQLVEQSDRANGAAAD